MIQHNAHRNTIIQAKHGRRQTSWLFTRRIEELNKGEPEPIHLMVIAGLGTSGLRT